MFWPCMSTEMKEYIRKCDICMVHCTSPGREPLQQHEFGLHPWSKIGVDLCALQGQGYLWFVTTSVTSLKWRTYYSWGTENNVCTVNLSQTMVLSFHRLNSLPLLSHGVLIITALSTVQWQGRKCCEDGEKALQEVPRIQGVRVSGSPRLAQHTIRRAGNQRQGWNFTLGGSSPIVWT